MCWRELEEKSGWGGDAEMINRLTALIINRSSHSSSKNARHLVIPASKWGDYLRFSKQQIKYLLVLNQ